MADMADKPKPQDDLSIEEILGSIRRIIAEDDDHAEKDAMAASESNQPDLDAQDDELLELTNKIEEDGTITDMTQFATPEKIKQPQPVEAELQNDPFIIEDDSRPDILETAPSPVQIPESSFAEDPTPMSRQEDEILSPDNLLSSTTAEATSAVMAKLARHTAIAEQTSSQGGVTIENLVREMLRPLLREWLDGHLPEMVETMVARELEKLSKRV